MMTKPGRIWSRQHPQAVRSSSGMRSEHPLLHVATGHSDEPRGKGPRSRRRGNRTRPRLPGIPRPDHAAGDSCQGPGRGSRRPGSSIRTMGRRGPGRSAGRRGAHCRHRRGSPGNSSFRTQMETWTWSRRDVSILPASRPPTARWLRPFSVPEAWSRSARPWLSPSRLRKEMASSADLSGINRIKLIVGLPVGPKAHLTGPFK